MLMYTQVHTVHPVFPDSCCNSWWKYIILLSPRYHENAARPCRSTLKLAVLPHLPHHDAAEVLEKRPATTRARLNNETAMQISQVIMKQCETM
jgi:hypothetical protein